MREYLTPDVFRVTLEDFNRGAGKPEGRKVVKLTWYDNRPMPRAPACTSPPISSAASPTSSCTAAMSCGTASPTAGS